MFSSSLALYILGFSVLFLLSIIIHFHKNSLLVSFEKTLALGWIHEAMC